MAIPNEGYPTWAENDELDPTTGALNKIEPTTEFKLSGLTRNEPLFRGHLNYQFDLLNRWVTHLDTAISIIVESKTIYVSATGDDNNNGELPNTAKASINGAYQSLGGAVIAPTAIVTIRVLSAGGEFDFYEEQIIDGYNASQIEIIGDDITGNNLAGVALADFTDPENPIPTAKGADEWFCTSGELAVSADTTARRAAMHTDSINNKALARTRYPTVMNFHQCNGIRVRNGVAVRKLDNVLLIGDFNTDETATDVMITGSIFDAGADYAVGDYIQCGAIQGSHTIVQVEKIDGSGGVTQMLIVDGGRGIVVSNNYSQSDTTGIGTGFRITADTTGSDYESRLENYSGINLASADALTDISTGVNGNSIYIGDSVAVIGFRGYGLRAEQAAEVASASGFSSLHNLINGVRAASGSTVIMIKANLCGNGFQGMYALYGSVARMEHGTYLCGNISSGIQAASSVVRASTLQPSGLFSETTKGAFVYGNGGTGIFLARNCVANMEGSECRGNKLFGIQLVSSDMDADGIKVEYNGSAVNVGDRSSLRMHSYVVFGGTLLPSLIGNVNNTITVDNVSMFKTSSLEVDSSIKAVVTDTSNLRFAPVGGSPNGTSCTISRGSIIYATTGSLGTVTADAYSSHFVPV